LLDCGDGGAPATLTLGKSVPNIVAATIIDVCSAPISLKK
jgi:hypothetical protein